MNVLMVAFDPTRLTSRTLRSTIASSFPGSWRELPGAAIVRTPLTAKELRDMLKPTLDENDELLVVTLVPQAWTWRSNNDAGVDWLRKNA